MQTLSEIPVPPGKYSRNIVAFVRGTFSPVPGTKPAILSCNHRQIVPDSASKFEHEPVECDICKEEARWEIWRTTWPR